MDNIIIDHLNKIDYEIMDSEFLVIEQLMDSYEKSILILENCNNVDFELLSVFQEGQTTNDPNAKKQGFLQKLWDSLLKLFGIVCDKSQQACAENVIIKTKETASNLEKMKTEDPDNASLTTQILTIMKTDKDFQKECYKIFTNFEKKSKRRRKITGIFSRVGAAALVAGGAYMAHKTGVDVQAADFAKEKVGQAADFAKQKAGEFVNQKVQQGVDTAVNAAQNIINAQTEEMQKEMEAMRRDIDKILKRVSANARKVFSLFSELTGWFGLPPLINLDDFVDLISYDAENGILHLPIDINLVINHLKGLTLNNNTSFQQIEYAIKNNGRVTIGNYIKYYKVICEDTLKKIGNTSTPNANPGSTVNSDPKMLTAEYYVHETNMFFYQEAANFNEDQAKMISKTVTAICKENNFTRDQGSQLASTITKNIDIFMKSGKPFPASEKEIRSFGVDKINELKKQTGSSAQLVNVNGPSSGGSQLANVNGNEPESKLGQLIAKGANKIQNTQLGQAVQHSYQKIATNLDMSVFAKSYREFITDFYNKFSESYKSENPIDHPIELERYVACRENVSKVMNEISKEIRAMVECIGKLVNADAMNQGGILNKITTEQLKNINSYLTWDGKFINLMIEMFVSVDGYLKESENVAAKMEQYLNNLNNDASTETTETTETPSPEMQDPVV